MGRCISAQHGMGWYGLAHSGAAWRHERHGGGNGTCRGWGGLNFLRYRYPVWKIDGFLPVSIRHAVSTTSLSNIFFFKLRLHDLTRYGQETQHGVVTQERTHKKLMSGNINKCFLYSGLLTYQTYLKLCHLYGHMVCKLKG